MNSSSPTYLPPSVAELEDWTARLDRYRLSYLLERLFVEVDSAWSRKLQLHHLREAMRPRKMTRAGLERMIEEIDRHGDFQRSYDSLQRRLATF